MSADGRSYRPRFSGFADECAGDIEGQIAAHAALGWSELDLRTVSSVPIEDIDRDHVNLIAEALRSAQITVSSLATRIGGWARPIMTPFETDKSALLRLAWTADRLSCRFLRIMSYPNDGLDERAWRRAALARVAQLTRIAADHGLVLLHENCVGWASQGPLHTLEMLREIDSDALRLVFDLGNPVAYGQDGLEFLEAVLPYVQHVHVKDAVRTPAGVVMFTFPGDGEAATKQAISMLLCAGYCGAWSIEPHVDSVVHVGPLRSGPTELNHYLNYGRCFVRLMQCAVNESREG